MNFESFCSEVNVRMATIKDIANMAGVSTGTVSKVINGVDSVSESRVARVNEAIRRLAYVPNYTARALKTNVSNSIGLILPDITNPYYAEFARGVENMLNKRSYNLFLCNKDRSQEKELSYIRALTAKNIDGIILIRPAAESIRFLDEQIKKPCVLFDCPLETNTHCAIVNVDDSAGAHMAMQYLYDQGHRRIAYCMGLMDAYSDSARKEGYHRFMEEHGLFDESLIWECHHYSTDIAYSTAMEILSDRPIPDAIFTANDLLAIGILKALYVKGIRVPDDVSVVGYDNIQDADYVFPPLTTVQRPKYTLGFHCAQKLLDMIQGKHPPFENEFVSPSLVIRQSVSRHGSVPK